MAYYLKKFETESGYNTYIGGDPLLPNVSLIGTTDVRYNPIHDYSQDYLTFKIHSDGVIQWRSIHTNFSTTISYSKNNGNTWSEINSYNTPSINVVSGDTILFKGNNTTYGKVIMVQYQTITAYTYFQTDVKYEIEGNIMSLIYGDDFKNMYTFPNGSNFTFYRLFYMVNPQLMSAQNLILPATALTSYCYDSMFQSCSKLTNAPALPATALTPYCYRQMFNGCTSLNYIKCLATDISAGNCTNNWISGVAASGTFVKASSANWSSKTGNDGIPSNWTIQNAS